MVAATLHTDGGPSSGHFTHDQVETSRLRLRMFRPEDLERLLTASPRFDDIIVDVKRVQPLGPSGTGGDFYRVDFDVKTLAGSSGI